jgi:hypothetical protein
MERTAVPAYLQPVQVTPARTLGAQRNEGLGHTPPGLQTSPCALPDHYRTVSNMTDGSRAAPGQVVCIFEGRGADRRSAQVTVTRSVLTLLRYKRKATAHPWRGLERQSPATPPSVAGLPPRRSQARWRHGPTSLACHCSTPAADTNMGAGTGADPSLVYLLQTFPLSTFRRGAKTTASTLARRLCRFTWRCRVHVQTLSKIR